MKIHKELKSGVTFILVFFVVIYVAIAQIAARNILFFNISAFVVVIIFCFILFFFRNPSRKIFPDNNVLIASADGKIVAIEEVYESEFLECNCIKISIFMSILDVHVNRYPISGKIIYSKYHPGKYFIAKYPKSSLFNEHQTVVIERSDGELIMVKQIAGIVARRIVCYARVGKYVEQGDDMGFIKFGSRVDMFVPMKTSVRVHVNEIVRGNVTTIGYISK